MSTALTARRAARSEPPAAARLWTYTDVGSESGEVTRMLPSRITMWTGALP